MADRYIYLQPSFSFKNRLGRLVWSLAYALLFRPSPRPFHRWRAFLLRCFGAKMGKNCCIYPRVTIWAPWNLVCEDVLAVADDAVIYNPSVVTLKHHTVVSQQAYLCTATHDYNNPAFPLISAPITLEAYSWVCARASVQPGVSLGEGAILGLGGVATKNLESWSVYGGIPARKIGNRTRHKFEKAG